LAGLLHTAPPETISAARRIMGLDPAHGWPHVLRVARLADEIIERGKLAGYDREVLATAIVLHDVGRFLPGEGHHAVKSAEYARGLLSRLGWEEARVEQVAHVILAHSYSLGVEPKTLEAMILSDADKLDALGAVGIARVFHTGCQLGRSFSESLRHFAEKILRLPSLLRLEASREIARERILIVEAFVKSAESEGMMWLDESDPHGSGGEVGRRH